METPSAADRRLPPTVVELWDGATMAGDLITPIPGDVRYVDLGTHETGYADIGRANRSSSCMAD